MLTKEQIKKIPVGFHPNHTLFGPNVRTFNPHTGKFESSYRNRRQQRQHQRESTPNAIHRQMIREKYRPQYIFSFNKETNKDEIKVIYHKQ